MRGDQRFGTIPGLLAHAATAHAARSAIEDGDLRLTYAQLARCVRTATAALAARGINHGDRVAIWAPNTWEWVVAALAIHSRGGVLVPINTRYKGQEAGDILDRSGARLLFTVDGFLGLDFRAMLDRPGLPVVVFRDPGPDGWQAFLDATADRVPRQHGPDPVHVADDDLSDILYTSGTTGRPKGVMSTHAQTVRAFWDWSDVVGLRAGDRYLVVAPFFHAFGYKAGWLACLMRGATILPQATFDVDAVLARIPADRVTMLPGPPALYQTLLQRDLSQHDLTSLRLAVTGAASIPVQLVEDMRDVLGFDTVITGYGLTEATGVVTMCRFDDDPRTIATTSGRAIPGVEVKVVDSEGRAQPAGQPGEVLVRGYNVMRGYFEDPDATARTIVDGWLHTGDVGVLDERGYLRITDRIKDMFIVGGFNTYPAEIEHCLQQHPAVAEVAVIGIPDPRLGEVGMAFVVPVGSARPQQEHQGLAQEIIDWAKPRLANFKVPRRVELVEALPRNASGKVLKFELRRRVGR